MARSKATRDTLNLKRPSSNLEAVVRASPSNLTLQCLPQNRDQRAEAWLQALTPIQSFCHVYPKALIHNYVTHWLRKPSNPVFQPSQGLSRACVSGLLVSHIRANLHLVVCERHFVLAETLTRKFRPPLHLQCREQESPDTSQPILFRLFRLRLCLQPLPIILHRDRLYSPWCPDFHVTRYRQYDQWRIS